MTDPRDQNPQPPKATPKKIPKRVFFFSVCAVVAILVYSIANAHNFSAFFAGIGDVNELLGTAEQASAPVPPATPAAAAGTGEDEDTPVKKLLRAIAVGLYILCPIPLILLSQIGLDTLGVCILLVIVAVATVMILLGAKKDEAEEDEDEDEEKTNLSSPSRKLRKSIDSLIGSVTLMVYLAVSFLTRAWGITWVIFLISGALKGLVNAILDLKEAKKHED